jgi:2-keto-4-pentenoate hydratase/2-oxohepta-3-ene-1,7-dioic acid hydratase in catechol pathway
MLLYRFGPEGFFAASDEAGHVRTLYSDPFETLPGGWEFGRAVRFKELGLMAPVRPGKIVGVGRNYADHARELSNPLPEEPLVFLKSPSSVIGPKSPILLPPESERVDFEGEIAVVMRRRLQRATAAEVLPSVLGVTCACDVTARDLQKRDRTFARAKSFDTFCPLGPSILLDADLGSLEVVTRINGEEKQRGSASEMTWGIVDLIVYVSQIMTLEAGDVVLTGTPAGVGPLQAGDTVEVEVEGVGVLENSVEERCRV